MHEIINWRVYSLKPLKFKEVELSRHKRSNSDRLNTIPEATSKNLTMKEMIRKNGSAEPRGSRKKAKSSLNEEILNLQKQLEVQFTVRHALENALNHHHPFSLESEIDDSIPKPTKELIKEITAMELEIMYLERYLLSLYRRSFEQGQKMASELVKQKSVSSEVEFGIEEDVSVAEKLLDSTIHRCHSSLSQCSASSFRASPPMRFLNKAVDSYHSLPLSMFEQYENSTQNPSSAEQLGTSCWSDNVPETPNCLSEEMIRCISAIYCELADPALTNRDCDTSPVAFSSSIYEASSNSQSEKWTNILSMKLPYLNSYIDDPYRFEGSEGVLGGRGPYCRMIKIQWICRDAEKLSEIETMLQKFRSIVYRLEDVDLRKMRHEEKLAFWINVHNSLVMHAFLVYGIPQNSLKRVSLVLKAAYNIGGHTISVGMIQNSILGCRLPRPGQWLRLLFSSKTKFKVRDARKAFSIEHPEPLLHFALCSGSQSDPAVRVYTPKRVYEEMERAREEYIRSNLIIQREQKIFLPKIVESFSKDSGLSTACLVEMIEQLVPESYRRKFIHFQHKKTFKGFDWIPHNFTFHYLLSKDLY